MPDQRSKTQGTLATPMISKRDKKPTSLQLDQVDMSKDGVQGNVIVSKGSASTFVAAIPKDGDDN